MMTIVLLPGMDGTGTLFESFAALLRPICNVRIVSYPSTIPLGYAELEAVAREALPTEGEFVILGESFSGPIAIAVAETCSSRLKGVILCCSFARNPLPFFTTLKPLVGFVPVKNIPTFLRSYSLLGRFSTSALRRELLHAMSLVSASVFRSRMKAVLDVDVSAKLSSLKVPLLYLCASEDRIVPPSASRLVSELSPPAQIVRIEAPHLLLQSKPAEAAQVVGAFLRTVQNAH